jgi:hypothetical protein
MPPAAQPESTLCPERAHPGEVTHNPFHGNSASAPKLPLSDKPGEFRRRQELVGPSESFLFAQ